MSGTYQSTGQPDKRRGREGKPVGGRLDGKHAQKHHKRPPKNGTRGGSEQGTPAHTHFLALVRALSRSHAHAFSLSCAQSLALMCPLVLCLWTSDNGESGGSEQDLARVRIVFLGLLLLDHWPCPRRAPCELKIMTCVPRFRSVAPRPFARGPKEIDTKKSLGL